jgi:hypothetical protein
MAFEYDDGNVEVVILGGVNKTTGKKNPTELKGYYLRKITIETKFGTKPFYVFKTAQGTQGLIGSGNLNSLMESKIVNLQTHVIDTGTTKDVGKGNPMKVFKVGQDNQDSLTSSEANSSYEATEIDFPADEEEEEETYTPPAPAARKPATSSTPSSEARAKVQALLSRNK